MNRGRLGKRSMFEKLGHVLLIVSSASTLLFVPGPGPSSPVKLHAMPPRPDVKSSQPPVTARFFKVSYRSWPLYHARTPEPEIPRLTTHPTLISPPNIPLPFGNHFSGVSLYIGNGGTTMRKDSAVPPSPIHSVIHMFCCRNPTKNARICGCVNGLRRPIRKRSAGREV